MDGSKPKPAETSMTHRVRLNEELR
jgi:hypothetical protein